MDDAPRTGGLQALLLIVGGVFAYVAARTGSVLAGLIAAAALASVVWFERYARRRVREDHAAQERRRRSSIAHLDFDDDRLGPPR